MIVVMIIVVEVVKMLIRQMERIKLMMKVIVIKMILYGVTL